MPNRIPKDDVATRANAVRVTNLISDRAQPGNAFDESSALKAIAGKKLTKHQADALVSVFEHSKNDNDFDENKAFKAIANGKLDARKASVINAVSRFASGADGLDSTGAVSKLLTSKTINAHQQRVLEAIAEYGRHGNGLEENKAFDKVLKATGLTAAAADRAIAAIKSGDRAGINENDNFNAALNTAR